MQKTIYFVHDEQEPPTARVNFLEVAGYEVVPMDDPDELMARLAERKPDLVLLDVLLKRKNGFDVVRELRVRYEIEDLPILLCSSVYTTRVYRDEARAAGANLLLVKPMKLDELLRHVNDLAGAAGPDTAVA